MRTLLLSASFLLLASAAPLPAAPRKAAPGKTAPAPPPPPKNGTKLSKSKREPGGVILTLAPGQTRLTPEQLKRVTGRQQPTRINGKASRPARRR